MFRKTTLLLTAILLLCVMGLTVFAHPVPDLTQTGSIEITMHSGETKVGGGTLTLYRVGEVTEEDGNYSFVPTGDFADCGLDFSDINSSALADGLAAYAADNQLTGTTETVGADGKVTFTDLELGLYLLVQNEAAEGYNKAKPFLVTVPQLKEGEYVYDVEASPKVELTPAPVPPPEEPEEPDEPDKPDEPQLPQTGQLNWPVPTLALTGLALFAGGWVLCSKNSKPKKERNEK